MTLPLHTAVCCLCQTPLETYLLEGSILHRRIYWRLKKEFLGVLEVRAIVTNPHKVTSAVANTFYFKFNVAPFEGEDVEASDETSVRLRRVLPESNDEGLQIWDKCIRRMLCDDADFDLRNNVCIMTT